MPAFQVHNSGSTAADVTLLFTWAVSLCLFVLQYTHGWNIWEKTHFVSGRLVEFSWQDICVCCVSCFLLTDSFGFRTDVCLLQLVLSIFIRFPTLCFLWCHFPFMQSICYWWCLRRPSQSSCPRQLEHLSTGCKWLGWRYILVFVDSVQCTILLFGLSWLL
jgi:hypothetical protein